jgi:hypothetical protein
LRRAASNAGVHAQGQVRLLLTCFGTDRLVIRFHARAIASPSGVKAYVENHKFGLEIPYRYGSETQKYLPDSIVLVDDGHSENDLLHLIVEIKGYRREAAKEKKATIETYWTPGVNNDGLYGRLDFAEFTDAPRSSPNSTG